VVPIGDSPHWEVAYVASTESLGKGATAFMILKTIRVGPFGTNCYIVGCETSKEAIVIDPGDEADLILEELKAAGLMCRIIVNTHGHVDHITANKALAEATGAVIAIGAEDAPSLLDPTLSLSRALGNIAKGKTSPPAGGCPPECFTTPHAGGTRAALGAEAPFKWCWNKSYRCQIAHGRVLFVSSSLASE
jgi:glyoxylase-like metal-dependent hydrolase (beta-lactamase superfamily II)